MIWLPVRCFNIFSSGTTRIPLACRRTRKIKKKQHQTWNPLKMSFRIMPQSTTTWIIMCFTEVNQLLLWRTVNTMIGKKNMGAVNATQTIPLEVITQFASCNYHPTYFDPWNVLSNKTLSFKFLLEFFSLYPILRSIHFVFSYRFAFFFFLG